jgi:hypothetical protein
MVQCERFISNVLGDDVCSGSFSKTLAKSLKRAVGVVKYRERSVRDTMSSIHSELQGSESVVQKKCSRLRHAIFHGDRDGEGMQVTVETCYCIKHYRCGRLPGLAVDVKI